MTGQADTDLDSALATSPFDAVHPLFPLWMQPRGKSKSISHRCYLREVAFDWELTNETIYLPLCGFQGALNSTSRFLPPLQNAPQCLLARSLVHRAFSRNHMEFGKRGGGGPTPSHLNPASRSPPRSTLT